MAKKHENRIMAKNRIALDFYQTHTKLTQALLDNVEIRGSVFEPCVGMGAIANVLSNCEIKTNDINPEHKADFHLDATKPESWEKFGMFDWIVTNPPFSQALPIIDLAFEHSRIGVAFLLRWSFLEPSGKRSGNRDEWLIKNADKLSHQIVFGNPRPSFRDDGGSDFATVAWFVFQHSHSGGIKYIPVSAWI